MLAMWLLPTNLDGDPLKLVFTAGFVLLGLMLCVVGIYWIVKKPKVKVGKFMARKIATELKMNDEETINIIKDFEV